MGQIGLHSEVYGTETCRARIEQKAGKKSGFWILGNKSRIRCVVGHNDQFESKLKISPPGVECLKQDAVQRDIHLATNKNNNNKHRKITGITQSKVFFVDRQRTRLVPR
jgi:hypothetical protein